MDTTLGISLDLPLCLIRNGKGGTGTGKKVRGKGGTRSPSQTKDLAELKDATNAGGARISQLAAGNAMTMALFDPAAIIQ